MGSVRRKLLYFASYFESQLFDRFPTSRSFLVPLLVHGRKPTISSRIDSTKETTNLVYETVFHSLMMETLVREALKEELSLNNSQSADINAGIPENVLQRARRRMSVDITIFLFLVSIHPNARLRTSKQSRNCAK